MNIFSVAQFTGIIRRTSLEVGSCTGMWSQWDDRDNPSATGDWEPISARADFNSLCDKPLAVQARVIETGALETTQLVEFDLNGLICKNENQNVSKVYKFLNARIEFC